MGEDGNELPNEISLAAMINPRRAVGSTAIGACPILLS